jgi:hypothetical protein
MIIPSLVTSILSLHLLPSQPASSHAFETINTMTISNNLMTLYEDDLVIAEIVRSSPSSRTASRIAFSFQHLL